MRHFRSLVPVAVLLGIVCAGAPPLSARIDREAYERGRFEAARVASAEIEARIETMRIQCTRMGAVCEEHCVDRFPIDCIALCEEYDRAATDHP